MRAGDSSVWFVPCLSSAKHMTTSYSTHLKRRNQVTQLPTVSRAHIVEEKGGKIMKIVTKGPGLPPTQPRTRLPLAPVPGCSGGKASQPPAAPQRTDASRGTGRQQKAGQPVPSPRPRRRLRNLGPRHVLGTEQSDDRSCPHGVSLRAPQAGTQAGKGARGKRAPRGPRPGAVTGDARGRPGGRGARAGLPEELTSDLSPQEGNLVERREEPSRQRGRPRLCSGADGPGPDGRRQHVPGPGGTRAWRAAREEGRRGASRPGAQAGGRAVGAGRGRRHCAAGPPERGGGARVPGGGRARGRTWRASGLTSEFELVLRLEAQDLLHLRHVPRRRGTSGGRPLSGHLEREAGRLRPL